MNFSGYVGHVIIKFNAYFCYLFVLWLMLGFDLVSGWLVVKRMYLCHFTLPMSHCHVHRNYY